MGTTGYVGWIKGSTGYESPYCHHDGIASNTLSDIDATSHMKVHLATAEDFASLVLALSSENIDDGYFDWNDHYGEFHEEIMAALTPSQKQDFLDVFNSKAGVEEYWEDVPKATSFEEAFELVIEEGVLQEMLDDWVDSIDFWELGDEIMQKEVLRYSESISKPTVGIPTYNAGGPLTCDGITIPSHCWFIMATAEESWGEAEECLEELEEHLRYYGGSIIKNGDDTNWTFAWVSTDGVKESFRRGPAGHTSKIKSVSEAILRGADIRSTIGNAAKQVKESTWGPEGIEKVVNQLCDYLNTNGYGSGYRLVPNSLGKFQNAVSFTWDTVDGKKTLMTRAVREFFKERNIDIEVKSMTDRIILNFHPAEHYDFKGEDLKRLISPKVKAFAEKTFGSLLQGVYTSGRGVGRWDNANSGRNRANKSLSYYVVLKPGTTVGDVEGILQDFELRGWYPEGKPEATKDTLLSDLWHPHLTPKYKNLLDSYVTRAVPSVSHDWRTSDWHASFSLTVCADAEGLENYTKL